jgi:hypothetical protein
VRIFVLALKVFAPVFVIVAALHLALGHGANAVLGQRLILRPPPSRR